MPKKLNRIPRKLQLQEKATRLSSAEKFNLRKDIVVSKKSHTAAAIALRSSEILNWLKQGESRATVVEKIKEKYDCKSQTAVCYLNQAFKFLAENSKAYIDNLRNTQLERLETILEDAMATKNHNLALKTIDIINKTFALYEIKTTVQLDAMNIKFKFGNQDLVSNSPQPNTNSYWNPNVERGFSDYEEIKDADMLEAGKDNGVSEES